MPPPLKEHTTLPGARAERTCAGDSERPMNDGLLCLFCPSLLPLRDRAPYTEIVCRGTSSFTDFAVPLEIGLPKKVSNNGLYRPTSHERGEKYADSEISLQSSILGLLQIWLAAGTEFRFSRSH